VKRGGKEGESTAGPKSLQKNRLRHQQTLQKRSDKMKQAFQQMGISIFSGTLTTFGSGAFLFGGQLSIFNKFAILITSTIMLSFACSMLLFGALCHIVGPENGTGDICRKKKNSSGQTQEFDAQIETIVP